MNVVQTGRPTAKMSLRLWPGVFIVAAQWLARFGIPAIVPEATAVRAMGALLGGLAILVWWTLFSHAPRLVRLGGAVLLIVAPIATLGVLHESFASAGMAMQFLIYAVPILSLAFVVWAVASRHLGDRPRRVTMVATILLACGPWTLVRTTGITGNRVADFEWRWAASPEDRLLTQTGDDPPEFPSLPSGAGIGVDWPGLRGPNRDGIVPGVRIETDWSVSPPVELWRRPIGPGWSSFAVRGDLLYTQEQRGGDELVTCYKMTTGEPIWTHRDPARFWESNTGAGPRATPTLAADHVYTFGATGLLNALDTGDGTVVWSRDVAADTGTEVPLWGFASSPLVVGDVVIVAVAGALVAYDVASGNPRWSGPARGGSWGSYGSPHLLTIDGTQQVLLLSGDGMTSVAPADGALLWIYPWPGFSMAQPAITANGEVLFGADEIGTRRIAVSRGTGGWTIEERWTSNRLKPYFNDFVVHGGHAFGFDGGILACIDLDDGAGRWKGGRYGHGQLILLADQDVLLVVSERGELALVRATPDEFAELARFPAITGKTWNHPVLVGSVLLVRNDQEMVAFRLELAPG